MRRIAEIVFGLVVIVACVRFLVGGGRKSARPDDDGEA